MPLISYISIPVVKNDGSIEYVRIQLDKNNNPDHVQDVMNQVSLLSLATGATSAGPGRFERD
jgi:hypothetical protein